MFSRSSFLALCLLATSLTYAQPARLVPQNGGDGSDGTFFLGSGTMTFDTDVQDVYNFQTFEITQNGTLRIIGSRPITIRVRTEVILNGTIDGSGGGGGASNNNTPGGVGGLGGPGGGNGGDGACAGGQFSGTGVTGGGVSPGIGGSDSGGGFLDSVGGGGGGGNATAGSPGGIPNSGSLIMGNASGAGGAGVAFVRAGSGGGGGACDIDSLTSSGSNDGGGGGGGGGGYISIYSSVGIQLNTNAVITVRGGDGGTSSGNGGGGGAGSGGTIDLVAPNLLIDGSLLAEGGTGGPATQASCGCSPGGNGGDGSIELRGNVAGSFSQSNPMPIVGQYCLMITSQQFIGEFDFEGNSGDAYIASFSGSLGAPLFIPGIATPITLNFLDPIYQLNYPINQIPAVFGGLFGNIGVSGPLGVPRLNMGIFVAQNQVFDLTVFAQGVTANSTSFTGVTPVVPCRIKL